MAGITFPPPVAADTTARRDYVMYGDALKAMMKCLEDPRLTAQSREGVEGCMANTRTDVHRSEKLVALQDVLEAAMLDDELGMYPVLHLFRELCGKHRGNAEVCEDDRADMGLVIRYTDPIHDWPQRS